jgi:hypothetical protein
LALDLQGERFSVVGRSLEGATLHGGGTVSVRVRALLLIALGVLAPQLAQAAIFGLSDTEWQRLMAGERVVHKQKREHNGLDLFGGTAWQRVESPASAVWDVVVQPELYLHLLPFTIAVSPISEADVLLRHRVALGAEISYRLRFTRDDARRVLKFEVPEGTDGDVRAGFGELHVRALDERSCLVAWTVFAKPDLGIVGSMFRGLVQRTMLEVPTRIRRFMARSHPARTTQVLAQH